MASLPCQAEKEEKGKERRKNRKREDKQTIEKISYTIDTSNALQLEIAFSATRGIGSKILVSAKIESLNY